MKQKTLDDIIRLNRIALDALAEVGELPADGLCIRQAWMIGNSNDAAIKRLIRQVEWLQALQHAHSTTLD